MAIGQGSWPARGRAGRAAGAGRRRSRRRPAACVAASRTPPSGCAPSRSACSRPRASSPRRSPRTRSSPTPSARRASTSPRCAKRSRSSPSRRRPTAPSLRVNDDDTVDVYSGGRKMRVAVLPDVADGPPAGAPRSSSTSRSTSCSPAASELTGEVVTIKEVLERRPGADRRSRRRGAGLRAWSTSSLDGRAASATRC